MIKTLSALALAALAAAAASAQTESRVVSAGAFEVQAEAAIQPMAAVDAFSGISVCGVVDALTFRPWSLEEASERANPCLQAVGRKYSAELSLQAGLFPTISGQPSKPGLFLKTDVAPGSKAHRDLLSSLARRGGRLLGHAVRLLTRGEDAPVAVSSLQEALKDCIMIDVVRDISNGADFVKIYGSCLKRNPDLGIAEIRPDAGLAVDVKTTLANKSVDALSGFVTVNAGKGPVQVMIVASSSQQ